MANSNNVIPFPLDKRRPSNLQTVRLDLEQRKVMVTMSIVSVLVFASVLNSMLSKTSSTQNVSVVESISQRSIASVDASEGTEGRQVDRMIASYGRAPKPIEHLMFGELKGQYQVEIKDQRSLKVAWPSGMTATPVEIKDRLHFLMRNREALPIEFASISHRQDQSLGARAPTGESSSSGATNSKWIDAYDLKDESGKVIARANFETDALNHLYSFAIEIL